MWIFDWKVQHFFNSIKTIQYLDGYFINLNSAKHPIRLLADGNFHGVSVDFKSKTLRIDGQDPLVSFDSPVLKNGISKVLILVNGSVAAIQLDQDGFLCRGSPYFDPVANPAILR